MPADWNVAAVLAHVGFWDARAILLLDKWASGANPSIDDCEPENLDWINDAGKPLCLALQPRDVAQLALRLADEADRKVAALSDEMLAKIIGAGTPFNLSRANHREEHLDDIDRTLSGRQDVIARPIRPGLLRQSSYRVTPEAEYALAPLR